MSRRIRSKQILSTEQLAEIGSVAVESTQCEAIVESLIWALSGMRRDVGKHFTHGIQLNNRLELLSTLGKLQLPDSEQNEFTSIISELKDLNNKRNQVIHGSWGVWYTVRELQALKDPDAPLAPKSMKRRLNTSPLEFSSDALKGLPEAIDSAVLKLCAFASRVWPTLQEP